MTLPGDAGQRPGGLGDRSRNDGLKILLSSFGDGGFEIAERFQPVFRTRCPLVLMELGTSWKVRVPDRAAISAFTESKSK
jgi:hypothetical protein